MQTTFTNGLSVSFKGKEICPGTPAYVQNGGIRTLGGIIAADNENKAVFGSALFAAPADPSKFFVGPTDTATLFRGILLNRAMVNEQCPGHADYVFNQSPADAFYQGAVWVKIVDSSVTAGDAVYATSTGSLSVTAASNTAINAVVKEIDPDTGMVLIYFDGQF